MRRAKENGDSEAWLLSYADLITNLLIFFVMLLSASQLSKVKFQKIAERMAGRQSEKSLSSIRKQIEQEIEASQLTEFVSTKLTDDGLELALNSGIVFDTGSAMIRPEWNDKLTALLQTLVPYAADYRFAVEGHTDSKPIAAASIGKVPKYASNWELSSARAMEVRNRIETLGVNRNRLRVEAYADTKPLAANETENLDPEEVLARHRRVVVRLY